MTCSHFFTVLAFIEEAMNATLEHASSSNRGKIAKTQIRVISWLEKAREEGRKSFFIPESGPPALYFPPAPKTETTIINAALALAEDVYFPMRTGIVVPSKKLRTIWGRLLTALCDLFLLYDPHYADTLGQTSGLALARRTWNSVHRRR